MYLAALTEEDQLKTDCFNLLVVQAPAVTNTSTRSSWTRSS